jgi:hypothetical protein
MHTPTARRISAHTLVARALLVATVLVVLAPVPARASSMEVIRDCSEDGSLEKHYSQKELAGALNNLPSDLDEYTDCRTVIRRAQLAGARGKRGDTPKGVVSRVDKKAPINREEEQSIEKAARGSSKSVHIDGKPIRPGATGAPFATAGLGTDLPTYVLAALIGLGLAMLSGAGFAVQRRWPRAWRTVGTSVGSPIRRMGDGVRRGISRIRR